MKVFIISNLVILFSLSTFSRSESIITLCSCYFTYINSKHGEVKMSLNELETGTLTIQSLDSVHPVKLDVLEFKIKYPYKNPILVKGNKLNAQAKASLKRLKLGDQVTIYNAVPKIEKMTFITICPIVITIK